MGEEKGGLVGVSLLQDNKNKFHACYCYENAKKQRFLIYSFAARTVYVTLEWTPGIFRNYYRQRQIADGICNLQNRPLPAICYKHPELYILCKKDENSMTVGLWNLFADTLFTLKIVLDEEYKKAEFYNCEGVLCKNKIKLDTDIVPYSFGFITLYK